jgi:hypothetical protein
MEPMYADFADAVRTAEGRAEATLVTLAAVKAKTSGDALAILARRFGDRWREKIDVRVELEAEVRRIAEESGVDYAEALAEVIVVVPLVATLPELVTFCTSICACATRCVSDTMCGSAAGWMVRPRA